MPLPPNWNALQGQLLALENSLMGQLNGKMPQFLLGHGWFFQGIKTAGNIPKQGEMVQPDLNGRPHYQAESWKDFAINFPPTVPATIEVFNFDGPRGKDWQLRMVVELDGVPWIKTVAGNGTEATTVDWFPYSYGP